MTSAIYWRHCLICTLFLSRFASADIFAFSNMNGFEACLRNTHLVETTATKTGSQKKYLNKIDIQERCFQKALEHLKGEKNASTIKQWVQKAFSNSDRANAIDLIGLQVARDNKTCNDSDTYDVFLRILSGPSSKDPLSLYQRARSAIHTCLKNAQFKSDFLEEQNSTKGSYQYTNVCEILKSEGLIKKCS
ncbi:MAG: hypothetical protein KDD51_13160 [Bdellovibrionales bacterium]|nr:hypothetical protein [Bdellovibrionales bacterium]